jgi:DNA-directed RNA polymerase specialized sigma24 family protein
VSELNPAVYDIVPSIARVVHNQYNKYVERDDIKQECIQWALSRVQYINEQLEVEDTTERRHNEQKIAWQMKRVAERYARKEKAVKSGYQLADEAYYQTGMLAQLLPFVIASVLDGTVLEQAQEMIRDGQPKGSSSPAEGGNLLAMLIDIKKCYEELEQEDKHILMLRYHENLKLEEIGVILECHHSTADRRCDRALRELSSKLGGLSPFQ